MAARERLSTAALIRRSINKMLASGMKGPSLVDCVSFEIMRRLDVRTAFAYDSHFSRAGFASI